MKKAKLLISFLIYLILSIIIYYISNNYIKHEEKKLLNQKYTTISKHMKKNLLTLIEDKKNATLAFAIATSKDTNIKKALLKKDNSLLDYKAYSKELREKTKFKNIWFHLILANGRSLYRSWTDKTGDSILFRDDIKKILKEKKIQSSISVGKFDMTFKSMIPIFENKTMLGVFEVVTHFNSISKTLEDDYIDTIVLADKKFKKHIKHPFTKKFINDYYIANLNAKDYLINILKNNNIEELLRINNYKIIQNNLLTTSTLVELDNKIIGYIALAKNLNRIDISNINSFKNTAKTYVFIFIVLMWFLFAIVTYYLYSNNIKKLNKKLEKNILKIKVQEKKNQTILDSQKNIIVITDGVKLKNANKQFLDFFDEYKSLEEFKKEHACICERFIELNDNSYLVDKDYDGKNWAEFILSNPNKRYKAAMEKDGQIFHFTTNVNISQFDDEKTPYIIVTLTDITQEIEQKEELKKLNGNLESLVESKTKELIKLNKELAQKIKIEIEKSKDKDRILFQQSKMASMGEMLENIAHQWRQPLNSISTAASSLEIQNELKLLNEEEINKTTNFIVKSTQYLSRTIEEFKNFFKQEQEKQNFSLKGSIIENLRLLKDKLKHEKIEVIINISSKVSLYGYKNEFQQAILNILNNSVDALVQKDNSQDKLIFIQYENNTLYLKDNGGGVDESILEKVFEPYFTTKHQSQGTGIGLYMTQEILKKHMNCQIKAQNKEFIYNKKILKGFCILIKLPIKK